MGDGPRLCRLSRCGVSLPRKRGRAGQGTI
nr:MAG TPA: hypothetical protein [Bacteriophage sp.]